MSFLYPFAGSSSSSRRHHKHHRSHSKDRHHRSHHGDSGSKYVGQTGSSHSSSRRRSSSPSIFSLGGSANRSSASSIFSGLSGVAGGYGGYDGHRGHSGGHSGFFSSSSSRRAKPRAGFISRMLRKIKRLFREIMHYAKRHPMKVFMLVIVPLVTGGALQKLLGVVGIRLPRSMQMGSSSSHGSGSGGLEQLSGGSAEGLGESVSGLMKLAKMFV